MPIDVQADLRLVSRAEFARVVYEAMAVFFEVHNELGRLFGETIYKTSMMKVTGFSREPGLMEQHLRRFLNHTRLEAVHWVNITRRALTFRTLKRGSS